MKEKTESETRDHRWIAISGLLFVAAWVAGLFVASPPAVTTPMANLIAYYEANRQMVMVQAYLTNGLTGILLMVFVAALQSALRRAEGESSTLSNLLLVAGTVVTSLSCLEALFVQVVANHIAATHDAAVIRTLLELNAEIDTFKLPILGIMIAAASWLSWRVQALPPQLVWVGAVEALLLVVASGNSLFPGEALPIVLDISALGLLVWTAAMSVMMGWRSRAVRAGGGLATLSRAVTDTSSSDAETQEESVTLSKKRGEVYEDATMDRGDAAV